MGRVCSLTKTLVYIFSILPNQYGVYFLAENRDKSLANALFSTYPVVFVMVLSNLFLKLCRISKSVQLLAVSYNI